MIASISPSRTERSIPRTAATSYRADGERLRYANCFNDTHIKYIP